MIAESHVIAKGYKQTEVGVIPDDWDVEPLGALTLRMTNGFVGPAIRHYTESGDGVLYIQGYNVEENSFNFHGIKYVTQEFHRSNAKSCLRAGDMLTVQTGEVGLTTVVPESLAGSNCHALIISRFDKGKVESRFMSYYLNSKPGRARLRLIETGTTMKHLNVGDMLHFLVPVPPTLADQEAIAEALGDADALIESLTALVAKKRHLKQAAMQQLLTGKKRLPGFEGEWELKRIGNLGSTYGGLTGKTKSHFGHGSARYIPFMNIMSNVVIDPTDLDRVDVDASESQNPVEPGDLFFNGSSETPEEVGMCSFLADDLGRVYVNSFCFGFRFRDGAEANGLLLAYYLRSQRGRDLLRSLAQGATRYNLSKTALMNVEVELPMPSEQDAISEVFTDMDAEIEAMEARLAKARQIKQGMMQELLTGRIRLV